jgi:hypothetical protein
VAPFIYQETAGWAHDISGRGRETAIDPARETGGSEGRKHRQRGKLTVLIVDINVSSPLTSCHH